MWTMAYILGTLCFLPLVGNLGRWEMRTSGRCGCDVVSGWRVPGTEFCLVGNLKWVFSETTAPFTEMRCFLIDAPKLSSSPSASECHLPWGMWSQCILQRLSPQCDEVKMWWNLSGSREETPPHTPTSYSIMWALPFSAFPAMRSPATAWRSQEGACQSQQPGTWISKTVNHISDFSL